MTGRNILRKFRRQLGKCTTQIQNFSIIIKYVKINHFIYKTINVNEIFNEHYIKLIFEFHIMISIKQFEIYFRI